MKLSIHYSTEDRQAAQEISSLCDELGLEYSLSERNDWLMRAFHGDPEGATHLLVVVSPVSMKSLWVPFQLGRAEERGLAVLPYLSYPLEQKPPQFLRGRSWVRGIDDLRARLRS